jgi:RNA polymerase sigma factor (sigma-70 family)
MANTGADPTDSALVAAVRRGDDRAFEELFVRYQRRIAAYVYGMVHDHGRAEDITQEVFLSALRRMRATETPIAFKPWVYEIAKNACIDAFRRARRAEEVSYDTEDGSERLQLVSTRPTPDAAVDTRMSLDHLRGALGGLSDAHHQILVMREFEGLSYRQIGERLGMSRPSVESTLFRARRRLSEEYQELVSGERCRRVQSIIADAEGARVGARDERRMARHVSYCQPCRRAAAIAGFDLAALVPRRTAREKIAALLPVPAFLKRWLGGSDDDDRGFVVPPPGHGTALAQWSVSAGHYADSTAGAWAKAAALAAAVAAASLTAGVATHRVGGGDGAREVRPVAVETTAAHGHGTTANGLSSGQLGSGAAGANGGGGAASGTGSTDAAGTGQNGGGSTSTLPGATTTAPVGSKAASTGGEDGADNKAKSTAGPSTPKLPGVGLPGAPGTQLPDPGATVGSTVGAVGDTAAGAGKAVGNTVTGATKSAGDTVTATTQSAGDAVGGVGTAVGGSTGETVKAVGDTVTSTGKTVGDTVTGAGKTVANTVSGAGTTVGDTVTGAGKTVANTAGSAPSTDADAGKTATSAAGAASDTVGTVTGALPKLPG